MDVIVIIIAGVVVILASGWLYRELLRQFRS